MLHARTAVADGRWARVGSSNLNLASWIGNFELDVLVEDVGFGSAMERMYLDDLAHATEVVLRKASRRSPLGSCSAGAGEGGMPDGARPGALRRRGSRGSAGRAATGALRLGNTVGVAITDHARCPRTGTGSVLERRARRFRASGLALGTLLFTRSRSQRPCHLSLQRLLL
jgi:cardiolipin synthase